MKTTLRFALALIAVLSGLYAYLDAQHHGQSGDAVTAGALREILLANGAAHQDS